ncbi:hypothetical protein SADUNF_Sadunf16G0287700 [Salix dunnii]|uniref:Translation initiation factor IF-2, chloroplastic n=1 Tax=Salix dunnii TaxID=1413687 RepID=A0A835JBE1_9ROSI|nr:hypothetical protein SADUNF_Sadunf16G0287700 [Salix dunnii]
MVASLVQLQYLGLPKLKKLRVVDSSQLLGSASVMGVMISYFLVWRIHWYLKVAEDSSTVLSTISLAMRYNSASNCNSIFCQGTTKRRISMCLSCVLQKHLQWVFIILKDEKHKQQLKMRLEKKHKSTKETRKLKTTPVGVALTLVLSLEVVESSSFNFVIVFFSDHLSHVLKRKWDIVTIQKRVCRESLMKKDFILGRVHSDAKYEKTTLTLNILGFCNHLFHSIIKFKPILKRKHEFCLLFMPSLASLVSLGSLSGSTATSSFTATDFIAEQGNAVSLDSSSSTIRGGRVVGILMRKKRGISQVGTKTLRNEPKTVLHKGPAPGKYRDRKKGVSPGTPRRRMVDNDVEIPDEELNVSIPGAKGMLRKGRKWTKASRKAAKLQAAREAAPVKVEILEVGEKGMSIEELAYNLTMGEGEILGLLFSKGIKPDGVQTLDKEMVKMICKEYEVEVIDANPVKFEEMAKKNEILDEDDLDKLQDRPPVLTIMGHVDHGKANLMDLNGYLQVAASEAGGITQGIGAYKVMVLVDGKLQPCVFLDTPGHEAFGAMRARGARVTDIAIIVVAADDGIRPQTNEAIAHAKAAGVPIVIAINKIDKDGANPERVMQELSSIGLMPEDWGGDVPMVQISALKGENIDDLLETVMLVAELQELKANPDRNAKGTVIEAGLDKSKGPVATFIIQNGTLKRGDVVVCGEAFGKVRALFADGGKRIDQVGPSIPVQVIGLNNVPIAGDEFEVVASLDIAREKAEARAELLWDERISAKAGDGKVTLSSLASAVSAGKLSGLDLHQLNIIMKVDLQGSIEAVRQALQVLPRDNVTLKFLLQATGDVSNSDIDLAVATEAIILGFNVKAPGSVKSYAEKKGVEIRLYRVIYELIDDVRNAMEGLLETVEEQEPIGSTVVRAVFSSGSGRVAGCMVTEGKVVKGCGIRVVRNRKTVHIGILDSLRRVKEIVKEVNAGLECGIGAEDYDDWEDGDIIEAFNTVEKKRTLEEASASMAAAMEEVGF